MWAISLRYAQYHAAFTTPSNTQSLVEMAAWSIAIYRNFWIIRYCRRVHVEVGSKNVFSLPAIIYHSAVGRQSAFTLELLIMIGSGYLFRLMAWSISQNNAAPLKNTVMAFSALNYVSLIWLVTVVDNAFHKIKTVCSVIAGFQIVMFMEVRARCSCPCCSCCSC